DVKSTAVGNTQTFEHKIGRLDGRVSQTNSAVTQARTGAVVTDIPSPAVFESAAVSNHVSRNGTSQATTELTVRQTKSNEGARTQASTFANVGNAWDLKGKAGATANVIDIGNTGGSLIVDAGQTNTNYVRAESVVSAYEFGIAQSEANGVGNAATVGNNDVYLRLDNTQFNDGGVDVQASFEGHNGYDSYVTANAIGNTLTAYSCAACKSDMGVTNHQTNQDGVKAQARTVITDAGRNTITSASAVGNSASIYVTRPQ
ncbi:MAG: holdfast anchor protein HfaD, partial [Asticcacaulis sp.]